MVFGVKPKCAKCETVESPIWQKDEKDQVLCTECFHSHSVSSTKKQVSPKSKQKDEKGKLEDEIEIKQEKDDDNVEKTMEIDEKDADESNGNGKDDDNDGDREKDSNKNDKKEPKRKTRKGRQGNKGNIPKGKGRRYIFKKSATKAPTAVATPVTSQYLFYKGMYYQVGDIVSVIDIEGGTYYGQIRGLLQDQYCEKSAVLTWLLPTKESPPPEEKFDPSTYIIGPEEDIPRKLEYMEFVCHAPSDYFKDRTSPYSTQIYQPQSCFVWTRMGPQIKPIEKAKELMAK